MKELQDSLIDIRPRKNYFIASCGRTVAVLDAGGFMESSRTGLYFMQTRQLSRLRYLIAGEPCVLITGSNVSQETWLGYFLQPLQFFENSTVAETAQNAIELRILATVGNGMVQQISLTNYTQRTVTFKFDLELDADFSDLESFQSVPDVKISSTAELDNRTAQLIFNGDASRQFDQQDYHGVAEFHRRVRLTVAAGSSPSRTPKGLAFQVHLPPQAEWNATMTVECYAEETWFTPNRAKGSASESHHTSILCPQQPATAHSFLAGLSRAQADLEALQATAYDEVKPILTAGVPKFTGFFARDTLTASWQTLLWDQSKLENTLIELAKYQGTKTIDWLDEKPGRILHEMQCGPMSVLKYRPGGSSYGSVTSSALFCISMCDLWRWTGNETVMRSLLDHSMRAMKCIDSYEDFDGDGFYEYKTRSKDGIKNQSWKDSGDAIVYPDGKQVDPPISICEHQSYIYLAKLYLGHLLRSLGMKDESTVLIKQGLELKKRFNERFWNDAEKTFAIGLDSQKNQIRTVASDPGHCLSTGIVYDSLAQSVAERLMAADMFSGWGIRTLAASNPAYNPWSYHRGSVWPFEQATFCLAFRRYGLNEQAERLCRAQAEALEPFSKHRWPEVFGGQTRDEQHPFPGIYPEACSPQAWSASAPIMLVHSMLGFYADKPKNVLYVDPNLAEWLPDITLKNMRLGDSLATLHFYRQDNETKMRIVEIEGDLQVLHRPVRWSAIEQMCVYDAPL